jgi:hypothetical protein
VKTHRGLDLLRVAAGQRINQGRMLGAGFGRDFAMEAKTENMQVGVEPRE